MTEAIKPILRRVLVIDADAEHAEWVFGVLSPVVESVSVVRDIFEADVALPWDLIIVNVDALEGDDREQFLGVLTPELVAAKMLFYTATRERAALHQLFGRVGLTNLLARSEPEGEKTLLATIGKLGGGDIFGLEHYLTPRDEPAVRTLKSSEEKFETIEWVRDLALRAGVRRLKAEEVAVLADELISNALYDAPVDEAGEHRFWAVERSVPVELEPHEAALVRVASSDSTFAISVRDPFGSLTPSTVLSSLARCFEGESATIRGTGGGAGLGMYVALEIVSQYVINIRPGAATETIGLIDIRARRREMAERARSFNVFVARP